MTSYLIPELPQESITIVKKSQFICFVEHCENREQAHFFIDKIKALHPTANHNCWAYIAGKPTDPSGWGSNDDGEPKGCAGKPMFNVIHHSNIGEICVVVTRYFGGIKLGTGGMARAYSGAVSNSLTTLKLITKHHYKNYLLQTPYPLLQTIEKILTAQHALITSSEYGMEVNLNIQLRKDMLTESLALLNSYQHQGLSIQEK